MQLLTTISAVTELVPTSRRGITIGYIVIGFMPFAPASLYGQQLAKHSWRWVCVFVGVLAVMAFVILATFYKPPPRPNAVGLTKRQLLARTDYLGGSCLSLASSSSSSASIGVGRHIRGAPRR